METSYRKIFIPTLRYRNDKKLATNDPLRVIGHLHSLYCKLFLFYESTQEFIIFSYILTLFQSNVSLYALQSAGVMSVYLFMKRYTAEEIYQPRHPSFYRPRLSNCSDHSGQFLHPEAWSRGRSPSDISSEASLQMSASYPALLKCPDYDQVSSSPC